MIAFSPTPMSSTPRATVRVAPDPAGIALAADRLDRFWAEAGLDPGSAWPVHVALDEVLSNIVRHGGAAGSVPLIDVTFTRADSGGVEVTVVDDGPEFDPLQVPEPDLASPLDVRRAGGLGIHLVRHLMDKVAYARRGERNWLVIAHRARPAGSPDRERD